MDYLKVEQLNPEITYTGVVRDLEYNLKDLKGLRAAYIESGEVSKEEIEEVFPELEDDIKFFEHMLAKLKEENIKTWFVENMKKQIKEEVSDEDLKLITDGLSALGKVEKIFASGLGDLLEFISPEGAKNKPLN